MRDPKLLEPRARFARAQFLMSMRANSLTIDLGRRRFAEIVTKGGQLQDLRGTGIESLSEIVCGVHHHAGVNEDVSFRVPTRILRDASHAGDRGEYFDQIRSVEEVQRHRRTSGFDKDP